MAKFALPENIKFNTGKIASPRTYASERGCVSWLYLCGEEFASMEGGMSYADVEATVAHRARVISDPPRVLNLDLARQHVAALDALPKPVLVSCRAGPRSSAVAYLYAGLEAGADPDVVVDRAVADGAPFAASDEIKRWLKSSLVALREERPK